MTTTALFLFATLSPSPSLAAPPEPSPPPPAAASETEAPSAPAAPRVLRVGVAGSAPFVTEVDGAPDGLALEVWRAATEPLGLESRYVPYPSADSLVAAIEADAIDVGVGPISITKARSETVAFTHPWMQAGIGIAVPPTVGTWTVFRHLFSRSVLYGLGLLLSVLVVTGTLLWSVEREDNDAFSLHPVHGIGDGMWLALVTMTTVGYGDIAPVTRAGRVIAGGWMLVAMVTASSLTAGIATLLTLSQLTTSDITHPRDLAGRTVGAVEGTTLISFANRQGSRVVPFPTLDAALAAAGDGKVDAVVHDRPILAYSLSKPSAPDLVLVEGSWEPTGYGFAIPLGDPLRHEVNIEILGLKETRQLKLMIDERL